jgi:hypothetical protein
VKTTNAYLADYRLRPIASENRTGLDDLWSRLPVAPSAYRGMGRSPLHPLDPYTDRNDPTRLAREEYARIVGDPPIEVEEKLLASIEDATRVYAALGSERDRWGIIHVNLGINVTSAPALGFDVGWWGGEFFSIISDAAVCPTWHPPDDNSFAALADALRKVNDRLLFNVEADALGFRDYYTSQRWSESEGGSPFVVVGVSGANES